MTAPWQTPTYSNEAYQLLAMAYENITGEAFTDAFKTALVEPLQLRRTFWKSPRNDSNTMRVDTAGLNTSEGDLGEFDPYRAPLPSLGAQLMISAGLAVLGHLSEILQNSVVQYFGPRYFQSASLVNGSNLSRTLARSSHPLASPGR